MNDNEMLSLDFNSIKLLKVLGEELNTTRAADRLYLSQSAVSKALKRLREQLDDPLFSRSTNGLEPTEKCQRLLKKLPNLMTSLNDLYGHKEGFEPLTYTGDIKININTTLCRPLMTNLFMRLHELAPHATISLENWSMRTEAKIKQGVIDLGINYSTVDLSKEVVAVTTNTPEFRLCCHKDSPLTKLDKVSVADIAQYPIVLAIMPDHNQKGSHMVRYFQERGYNPHILLKSDKIDICMDTVRKVHSVMGICEIAQSEMFEELTLLNINHWEDIFHRPIACHVAYKFKDTSYTKWLINIIQEVIEELY
ncbi:LysR family transcriptional regulator [Vibrio mexicanus]|uniref:LysR family transcriptional regulator n=1 Tax=Vibrio mexicanus TaxID=1004326 RepID=UPI00063CA664|nr:LysR family transcriptional regulator [Vibrio mexicanus]